MTTQATLIGVLMCAAFIGSAEFAATAADEPVRINVSPAVSFAPATLMVQATIASHVENRALEVTAESEAFYRSSQRPLEGDRAARVTSFEFRDLPAGSYHVSATLLGANGERRASVHRTIDVVVAGSGDASMRGDLSRR